VRSFVHRLITMEVHNSGYHCRWCSMSYAVHKILQQHERRAHPEEKKHSENDYGYERLPLVEKKKWYTCNICRVRALIKFRLLHDSSFMHMQHVASSKTLKCTTEVEHHSAFSSHGFTSVNGAGRTHSRSMQTDESMSSEDYAQSEFDRVHLASTRSPTLPYRACDYSSEEYEEEVESGGLEKRMQFYLSQRDDPSFWSVGSVNGPFRKTGRLLGQPTSFGSYTCSRKNHFV
jgi:hypothetical protein